PRTFASEIPGYVIFVRDGNKAEGVWNHVFIYAAKQPDGSVGILTARSGRIDSSRDKSELVLQDTVRISMPAATATDQTQDKVEHLDQIRVVVDTGRAAILDRLENPDLEPSEMLWRDLRVQAATGSRADRREAVRTMQNRLALSISPLVFALVGGALGL